jgi:hypothetical protein
MTGMLCSTNTRNRFLMVSMLSSTRPCAAIKPVLQRPFNCSSARTWLHSPYDRVYMVHNPYDFMASLRKKWCSSLPWWSYGIPWTQDDRKRILLPCWPQSSPLSSCMSVLPRAPNTHVHAPHANNSPGYDQAAASPAPPPGSRRTAPKWHHIQPATATSVQRAFNVTVELNFAAKGAALN